VLRGKRSDLRSGEVHLLIADGLRHLGRSVMSICRWRVVGAVVFVSVLRRKFGGLSVSRLSV
jgi:hypothetical protein